MRITPEKTAAKTFIAFGIVLAASVCMSRGADKYWQGGIDNWNDLNWSIPSTGSADAPPPFPDEYAIINTSDSIVTIDSVANSNGFTLGGASNTELRITTGAAYNASASGTNFFLIGDNTGVSGSFHGLGPGLVTMDGGFLDYAGTFFIFGRQSNGTLNQSGGFVTVNSPQLWVGQLTGTTGILNISGGTFRSTNTIGDANPVSLGVDAGSYGQINVSGAGTVEVARTVTVGRGGRGSLNVTGGSFTSGNLYVGRNNSTPAGTPSGSFTATAGTVQTNGNLAIGFGGSASGTIAGSASVNVTGGTYVGTSANTTSSLTVSGGSLTSNGSQQINYVGNLNGANGTLNLTGGTTAFWHLVQGSNGTAGTATTAVGVVNISNDASLAVTQDWRVGWGGTGILNLDNSSAVSVGRNFVVQGASSQFNLTLSDYSDAVTVAGGTFFFNSNPSLSVTLSMEGVRIGDQFVVVNAAGAAVTGGFFAGKPDDATFQVSNLKDSAFPYEMRIDYNAGADNRDIVLTVTAVPEPSTAALMGVAAAVLGSMRRTASRSRHSRT